MKDSSVGTTIGLRSVVVGVVVPNVTVAVVLVGVICVITVLVVVSCAVVVAGVESPQETTSVSKAATQRSITRSFFIRGCPFGL